MENVFKLSRRLFVKSAFALATLVAAEMMKPVPARAACIPTPRETAGPFYPLKLPLDKDNDLTFVNRPSQKALGEVIFIQGRVRDESCQPVAGALVEIWQACTTGKYNHPGDSNSAALDPHFQYWGKTTTNSKGEYGFKTVKPGSYPVHWLWTRPPHIHFTVRSRSHLPLTTQMYFAGNPLNAKDRLFRQHSPAEQAQCTVLFRTVDHLPVGQFDLTLRKT